MDSFVDTIDAEPAQAGYVAAYLRVVGDECAFIECYTEKATEILLGALRARGKSPEQVRYVVVTHAHLDHAGGAGALMAACPNATLLAHPRAARHLIDPTKLVASATAVYGEETFRRVYGSIRPIAAERVRALEDGAGFDLGGREFQVFHALGHAKHHFVVSDPDLSALYTGDAFGLVYPALQRAGMFALPSTSPTDFDGPAAIASVERIAQFGAEVAYLTHMGAVRDLAGAATQLCDMLRVSQQLYLQARERSEDPELSTWLMGELRDAITGQAERVGLDLSEADWKLLAIDHKLNADGLAFAARR